MNKTVLVKELVEDGWRLVERLEKRRFPLSAAFWHFDAEGMRWKLVIASSLVDRKGPLDAYTRIQQSLAEIKPTALDLDYITVMSPNSNEFEDLQMLAGVTDYVGPSHRREVVHDLVFEDAYVYRRRTG